MIFGSKQQCVTMNPSNDIRVGDALTITWNGKSQHVRVVEIKSGHRLIIQPCAWYKVIWYRLQDWWIAL